MTLQEFKDNGLAFFGQRFHGELFRQIRDTARLVQDQLLVTGWGLSPISAMIYEVGPSGHWLHSAACFAAIGSGSQLAQSMLMQLGQRRESTLAETIFNVACAKFSSEKSAGLDVGYRTTIYVARKRSEEDAERRPCGDFLQDDDIGKLRALWEEHLKPRVPDEARAVINGIAASINQGKISIRDMAEHVNAANRLIKKGTQTTVTPGAHANPQSTTADPSHPQPSRGSPGGIDES